jgi:hypothetical protein
VIAAEHHHALAADSLDAAAFQRAVLDGLSGLRNTEAVALAPFRVRVRVRDRQDLYIRLDGMAKAHRHGELSVEAAVAEIALAAGAPGAEALAARAGVTQTEPAGPFPKLMRRDAMPELPPQTLLRPCDFEQDLVVGYVRTLPHGQIPLTLPEVAERWQAVDDLHAEALHQLQAVTRGVELQGLGAGAEVALGFATGDGHDAARALLSGVLAEASALLEGGTLAAVPCRDLLLLIGDGDARFTAEARDHVAEIYRVDAHPISPHFYQLGADGRLRRRVA